jgi:uncharacterized protein (TIGR02246 family)
MTHAMVETDGQAAAVKSQNAAFVDAWNRHDSKAISSLHTDDADSIAPWHERISGRAAIEKMLAERHSSNGALRESTFAKTIDSVRFPSGDVAITDSTAVVTGAYAPDGSKPPPATFQVTEVWKKTAGRWLIFACRIYPKATPSPRPNSR